MTAVIETCNLTIGYRLDRKPNVIVAQSLDLSVNQGELVCLLGPNGVGKSTLMRTIAGMQHPLAGQVLIGGDNLTALSPHQRSQRMSVVLTDRPNLGLLNGYALVALGRHPYTDWMGRLSEYDKAVIRWAVNAVGADDIAERPVMQLSDGQRQKFMIARALAQETDLILLDEPTAYLDLPRRAEIMHLLQYLAAETGRTILLSTHDLDLALRSADTLWLMSDDRMYVGAPEDLVLDGSFEQAFEHSGTAFDRTSGSFQVQRENEAAIVTVGGYGVPYTWTVRALKRAGFSLEDGESSSSLQVNVSGNDDHPVWHLDHAGHQSIHNSIRDLLDAIRSISQSHQR